TLFILLNTRKKEDWNERAGKAANDIKQLYDREQPRGAEINFGIGQYCEKFQHMRKSFQATKEVLHLKKVMPHRVESPFYQDLHM
ncbi:PucR family transcriptional regulator, partial [Bacillus pumilus]